MRVRAKSTVRPNQGHGGRPIFPGPPPTYEQGEEIRVAIVHAEGYEFVGNSRRYPPALFDIIEDPPES